MFLLVSIEVFFGFRIVWLVSSELSVILCGFFILLKKRVTFGVAYRSFWFFVEKY